MYRELGADSNITPPLSKAELFDLRAKQLHAGVQFDQAGPKRICAASTPVCFEPMFEPLAQLSRRQQRMFEVWRLGQPEPEWIAA